ncbi:MAG TPA: UPF0179 family protein [Thermoplasmata archaeon]|nr:UPF0179 family protein [Thermoplasmata archaeon]
MTLVTLVGETNAREGFEFIYVGPTPDCRNCKIKNACINLERGVRYRITRIRDVVHDCKLHDRVRVVEVEPAPVDMAVESRLAVENTIITVEERRCLHLGCEHHPICVPNFFHPGRYRVVEAGDALTCHRGLDLKAVRLVLPEK